MKIDIKGKRVVVLGMGKSGISASILLARHGANCIVSELKEKDVLKEQIDMLRKEGVEIELGGHKLETILSAELIIISPGIPLSLPMLDNARERKIPVISEIELAYRFLNAPLIGITGTKGKTTTTTLVAEILKNEGKDVILAGNIGIPITSKVDEATEKSIIVTEISSFQLEATEYFKPYIAAILNVSQDHMDRYSSIQDYVEDKVRILHNQDENDFAILNFDNKFSPIMSAISKANLIYFSSTIKVERGVWLDDNKINTNINGYEQSLLSISDLLIKGPHNAENAMAAVAIATIMKVNPENIIYTLKNFKGVEHRQEYVATIDGVKFINNSQGTNIDAVTKSLMSYSEPIILIMGGRNKGADFSELKEIIKKKVKTLILIGEAKEQIATALNGATEIYRAETLQDAVKKAFSLASPGECIMLSPACSSFDMFRNYEERGKIFKEAVLNLK